MADKLIMNPRDGSLVERFRDMGDGTFAMLMVPSVAGTAQMANATSGNVANAVATATMAAVADKTNHVTGFSITGLGATAALGVLATLTGVVNGPLSYAYAAVAGAVLSNAPLVVSFPTPIPASAVNTAISLSLPALGLGNTSAVVTLHGYRV